MTTANENIAIAATILDQLAAAPVGRGWGRLKAMMNIRNLAYGKQSVQFNFSGCKKYNKVQISLNGDDLYDMIFVPTRNPSTKNIVTVAGIFDDQLAEQFTYVTGLDTHL